MAVVNVFDDAGSIALAAAELLRERAIRFLDSDRRFTVSFSWGSVHQALCRELVEGGRPPFRETMPWEWLRIVVGHERHVDPGHADSHYGALHRELLDRVALRPGSTCRYCTEADDPSVVVSYFDQQLSNLFALEPGELPVLDLAFLELDTEGNLGGIPPQDTSAFGEAWLSAAVWDAATKRWSFSLTPHVLRAADAVVVLASGLDRSRALRDALERPARLGEQTFWFVDRTAAARLDDSVLAAHV